MNKHLNGAIVLTGMCYIGLATISIAESKIYPPSDSFVKDIQIQRLNDSLSINLEIEPLDNSRPKASPQLPQPVSDTAVDFIKEFEGFKGHAYIDTDGTPVIGYGLSKIAGKPVRLGDRITAERAEAALKAHLQEIDKELSQILKVKLSDRQKSALASIAFNVGINAIKNSTLVRKINAKDFAGAANEFLRWDKANIRGRLVQMPGLVRRRTAERELFLGRSS